VSESLECTREPSARRRRPSFLYTLLSLPAVSSRRSCGTSTNDSQSHFRPRVPAAKKDGQRNDVDTPATSFPCARFIPANNHGHNCFKNSYTTMHRVSIKRPSPLTCYNLDTHGSITIIFGTSVTEKVGSQLYFIFPPRLTCASALPGETGNPKIAPFHLTATCFLPKTRIHLAPGYS